MAQESVSTKMESAKKKTDPKMKKLRVAIIGCGGIAQTHLNAYKEIPEVEIVAGVDILQERLDVMQEKWGLPKEALFKDWKEMLKVVKPDAVASAHRTTCTAHRSWMHAMPAATRWSRSPWP